MGKGGKTGMTSASGVQSDMQWIRRCKQEEIALIDSFNDEDEVAERMKLMKMYEKKA